MKTVARQRGRASDIDPVDIAVGAHIRALRQARGISQSALGAYLGVTFQQIQKYKTARIGCRPAICIIWPHI
ncbi:helix-turn-helix transcriptional regulator [Rhizobium sp. LjRoot30]|uniref:helix-turn-helix domain-containing protein n=1 Tax=Rhizobium sp. LjRoot30 TaxID=3342320 RepID=UPI003ECDEBFD